MTHGMTHEKVGFFLEKQHRNECGFTPLKTSFMACRDTHLTHGICTQLQANSLRILPLSTSPPDNRQTAPKNQSLGIFFEQHLHF
jgi:hypothetical protein